MLELFQFPRGKDPHRRQYKDWLEPPSACDVCSGPVVLVQNRVLYRQNMGWAAMYWCLCCGAAVGCHKGTAFPLGRMADAPTRSARGALHRLVDPLWQGRRMTRDQVYAWLGGLLGLPPGRVPHIAEMDAATCERVTELVRCFILVDDFGA